MAKKESSDIFHSQNLKIQILKKKFFFNLIKKKINKYKLKSID